MIKRVLVACGLASIIPMESEAFEINISSERIDEINGQTRASDLGVTDIAYFYARELCRKGDRLFLPSTQIPTNSDDTHSFLLKVTVGANKELTATTLPPTKAGVFDEKDVTAFIAALYEPQSFFNPASWDCDSVARTSIRHVEFYPVVSIDGHDNLLDLVRDLEQRWQW